MADPNGHFPHQRSTHVSIQLANVTLDCDDTGTVAAFWFAALDRPVDDGGSEFCVA